MISQTRGAFCGAIRCLATNETDEASRTYRLGEQIKHFRQRVAPRGLVAPRLHNRTLKNLWREAYNNDKSGAQTAVP